MKLFKVTRMVEFPTINEIKEMKSIKKEQKMKTIKEQLADFGAQNNDLVILKNVATGEILKETFKVNEGPEGLHYLYSLHKLESGFNRVYKEIRVLRKDLEVVAVYYFVGERQCNLSGEFYLKYQARTKKEQIKLPDDIEEELKIFENYSTHSSTEYLRKAIAKHLLQALVVFFFFVNIAQAEVCPFGNCPKVTPLSCYESLTRPECLDTHIDYGNDLEEWEYISSQMPKQIKVAGNFIHSGDNQAEYFRCKYLRERRLRIGKVFSGWAKVNCREYLK